jgi:hypothetical protein
MLQNINVIQTSGALFHAPGFDFAAFHVTVPG